MHDSSNYTINSHRQSRPRYRTDDAQPTLLLLHEPVINRQQRPSTKSQPPEVDVRFVRGRMIELPLYDLQAVIQPCLCCQCQHYLVSLYIRTNR